MSFQARELWSHPTVESCHDHDPHDHDPYHERFDPCWWLHAPIFDPWCFRGRIFQFFFVDMVLKVFQISWFKSSWINMSEIQPKKWKECQQKKTHSRGRATCTKRSRFTTLLRLNTSARSTSALFNCRSKLLLWGIFSAMVSTAEAAAAFSTKHTWLLLRSTCWPSDRVNWNEEGGMWQETVARMPSNFSLPARFDNLQDENG